MLYALPLYTKAEEVVVVGGPSWFRMFEGPPLACLITLPPSLPPSLRFCPTHACLQHGNPNTVAAYSKQAQGRGVTGNFSQNSLWYAWCMYHATE